MMEAFWTTAVPRHPVKLTSIGFRCAEQGLKTSEVQSPVDLPTLIQVMRIIVHVLSMLDGNFRGCSQMTGYLDSSTPLLLTHCKIMCLKAR